MAQYATDEAGNVWDVSNPSAPVFVRAGGQQAAQPMTIGTPDPAAQYAAPKAALDLETARATLARTAAAAPYDARKAAADAARAEIEAASAQRAFTTPKGAPLTAKERSDALAGYKSAEELNRIVAQLEQQFAAGPGSTQGLAGLTDYLPLDANKRFDSTGNAARGIVGQALGFTGGQLNTATEAAMAVGPYLPQAEDRDSVIRDKIDRLRALAQSAQERSIAQLGGRPNENGMVTPLAGNGSAPFAPIAAAPTPGPGGPPNMPPSGPSGGIGGGVTDAPTAGGSFGDAAGVAMAGKLSAAYNQGAKIEQLNALLAQNGYQPFTDPDVIRTIQRGGRLNFDPPKVDDTRGAIGRTLGNAATGAAGAYGLGALNAVTGGYLDELAGGQTQLAKEYGAQNFPGATLVGTITGGTAAALPIGRAASAIGAGSRLGAALVGSGSRAALTGDAAYGALLGSGEGNDNRAMGALTGAGASVLGSAAGSALVRSAGKLTRGVADPAVQYLTNRNIPLTIGQTLGNRGLFGRGINKLESAPVIGDMLGARRLDSMAAFNREAIKDALEPIGATTTGEVGQAAVGQAQDAVSNAYDNALSGVRVAADQPFVNDLSGAMARGRAVPVQGEQFGHLMDARFAPLFGPGATLDGKGVQAAFQTVRGAGKQFGNEGAMGSLVADELANVDSAVADMVTRQAPGVIERLGAANQSYANLQAIQDATLAALNGQAGQGVFTPTQLTRAVANNTRRFGGKGAAARGAKQTELMTYGQEVLPSTVPNSGSADRIAALALPSVLGGGAYSMSDVSPGAATALALAAAATSRPGSKVLQTALVKRPDAAKKAGEAIIRRARLGGIFGAPLAIDLAR